MIIATNNQSMKTNQTLTILITLSLLLFSLPGRAADITAAQSGNWSDTNTWIGGAVPGINDDADIPAGIDVIVDTTNVVTQFIYDEGTVTMGANSTLDVTTDQAIDPATTLDSSAPGNTVIYSANAHFAKPQNYYNLILNGLGTLYTGLSDLYPAENMIIANDLIISGTASIQAGANITIDGDLTIGTTNISTSLDCSVGQIVVEGNTVVNGFLLDGDGAPTNTIGLVETNNFMGNLTINPGATMNVSDVTQWAVGGNFTNLGTIKSAHYGSIDFYGPNNSIAGNPFSIRTITVNGSYAIDTTITLATNTPTLNGTLIFDLASTNKLIFAAGTNTFYYSGNLTVINSGPAPAPGNSYQLFSAPSYAGSFNSITLPSLPAGLSWVNNLATSGSLAVSGSTGSPVLTVSKSGTQLTLSWNSANYPGYEVLAQTNRLGISGTWAPVGSGTTSPYITTINPSGPPVYFRLSNP
jgi:hypothetical protein